MLENKISQNLAVSEDLHDPFSIQVIPVYTGRYDNGRIQRGGQDLGNGFGETLFLVSQDKETDAVELIRSGSLRLGLGWTIAIAPIWGPSPPQMAKSISFPTALTAASRLYCSSLVMT